jgi:hypothetical protein
VRRRHLGFLGFPLLLSCNTAASGTIQIITGEETDTFTQSPVPTQILVLASNTVDGGAPTTLATAAYPTDTIDLGNQDQDAVASLLVEAQDSSGNNLVYGASVLVQYGALDGETLPIFVQRVGQNARLPNPPVDTRQSPTLGILSDRFLIIGGGSETDTALTTQVYDFAQFNLLDPAPTLPFVPASMPIVGTIALLIDPSQGNNASYYDFSEDTGVTVTGPTDQTGFTFADVAGGQTIYDPNDGYVFVVGATRTTAPSSAVLMINTNDSSNATYETGNLSWLSLTAPRQGAAAAWVPSRGLVVAGGNGGSMVAGVEILDIASGQTLGTELPYAPDGVTGAAMTALDSQGEYVLLAGGVTSDSDAGVTGAGVRQIDLGCADNCGPTYWGPNDGALPVSITSAVAFTFTQKSAFVVGSEPGSGLTHTFTLDSMLGATEVPTKVPHTNASATLSPMGSSILIYGGASGGEIESFTPAP